MKISGKAIVYGDNVNTDVIIPSKYLTLLNSFEIAKHAMEGLDPTFAKKAKYYRIIVAGKNFGCGSSREQAPIALKQAGAKCILAESFARIFFRNAINIGLPLLESPNILKRVQEGDTLIVDLDKGEIINKTEKYTIKAIKLPTFILDIVNDGGLIENLRKKLGNEV